MLPTPKLPHSSIKGFWNHRTIKIITHILVVLIVVGIGSWILIQKIQNANQKPIIRLNTDFKFNPDTICVGITEIVLDPHWSLVSSHNGTVIFRGKATVPGEKIKFACFVYKPIEEDEWTSVDAVRRNGGYEIKLRDLKRDTPYECVLLAVTKKGKYASKRAQFKTQ